MNKAVTQPVTLATVIESSRLCVVGGKGGVGKTTIAAALAADIAERNESDEILCVSVDPAHSLFQLFGSEVSTRSDNTPVGTLDTDRPLFSRTKKLSSLPNLSLQEYDFATLMKAFQSEYGSGIESLIEKGSYLTKSDIQAFVDLSLPALGELMALMQLADLVERNVYRHIVVDAAPTGHTLRLLELPNFLEQLSELMNMLKQRHSVLVSSLVGRTVQEAGDQLPGVLWSRAEVLVKQLRDPSKTQMVVVALAEKLSLEETKSYVEGSRRFAVNASAMVINKVSSGNCDFCEKARDAQQAYIQEFAMTFPSLPIFASPLLMSEPHRVVELSELIRNTVIQDERVGRRFRPSIEIAEQLQGRWCDHVKVAGRLRDFLNDRFKLVIFAGKGGVGKTTVGAAAAVALSERHPNRRVLAASIDPAHSLGDAFQMRLSNEPTSITNNLSAVEIDAKSLLREFRDMYHSEASDLLGGLLQGAGNRERGASPKLDAAITEYMLNLETPDLDEFLVFRRLTELRSSGKYDLVFLDPPPAGHLMRFLQLPSVAAEWITALMTVINKHHAVEKTQKTFAELLSLLKAIRSFEAELRNPSETAVIAIGTPQELVLAGTVELIDELNQMEISCEHVLINMIRPDNSACPFCTRLHQNQIDLIRSFELSMRPLNIVSVDQACIEIRGVQSLSILGESLYG